MSAFGSSSLTPEPSHAVYGKGTLTLNGEPLARMVPIRRRQAVPKDEVLAIFAAAPVIDVDELRSDLDAVAAQDLRDPYEETGL